MQRLKYLVTGMLAAVLLTGCGQTVIETLNVPQDPGFNAPGTGRSVVILPFADYSGGDSIESAYRRNLIVSESLTDRFVANGFSLPVEEDVFKYLVEQDIISVAQYGGSKSSSLTYELKDTDWSPKMISVLEGYVTSQEKEMAENAVSSPGTHGLTTTAIAKIGREFDADYVVRGRILEFKTRNEANWAPWKMGLLPFVGQGVNQVFLGFADSESYDIQNSKITGATIGSIIGYKSSNWPWGDGDTVLGMSGGDTANAILWGAVGGALADENRGKVDQAVVQLRIWVQEAATGNVVWTNRVRVQVAPETVFADNQYDILFNSAIEKGVSTLVENFVSYGL